MRKGPWRRGSKEPVECANGAVLWEVSSGSRIQERGPGWREESKATGVKTVTAARERVERRGSGVGGGVQGPEARVVKPELRGASRRWAVHRADTLARLNSTKLRSVCWSLGQGRQTLPPGVDPAEG